MSERQQKSHRNEKVTGQGDLQVAYREEDFLAFVRKLHRKYPSEWIALAIESEEAETGERSGTIIAHDRSQGVAMRAASDFHEANPSATVRFFLTDMASSGKYGVW